MSSSIKHYILNTLRGLLALGSTLAPLWLFLHLFQAEGPFLWLFIHTGINALLLFLRATLLERKRQDPGRLGAGRTGRAIQAPSRRSAREGTVITRQGISMILAFLSALSLGSMALIVLVQLNITRQSLALAWLELARNGQAFGYFSFFASQLWALFLLPLPWFIGRKAPLAALGHGLSASLLAGGIILSDARLIGIAIPLALLTWLILAQVPLEGSRHLQTLPSRLLSLAPPLGLALAFALLWQLVAPRLESTMSKSRYVDFSFLIQSIAPHFPLLSDMPGYGFSISSMYMPQRVFLSDRVIFDVNGPPFSTLYLAEGRFAIWNGAAWERGIQADVLTPIRFLLPDDYIPPSAIRLVLREDLLETAPMAPDTGLVILKGDYRGAMEASLLRGIRFTEGARRGLSIIQVPESLPTAASVATPAAASVPGDASGNDVVASDAAVTASFIPNEVRAVSRRLRSGTDSDEAFLRALLAYFMDGFTYSLTTPTAPQGVDPLDWFLTDGRKGFCVWFAAAFVLACQDAGLEARMAEGYRILLDQAGQGRIRGYHAHAWPEVRFGTEWLRFEPTPPFAGEDPFANMGRDRNTRDQLRNLFPASEESSGPSTLLPARLIALFPWLLLIALGLFLAGFTLVRVLEREEQRDKRRGRRMVARYRRRGIPGPDSRGWLVWEEAVQKLNWKGQAKADCALSKRIRERFYGN